MPRRPLSIILSLFLAALACNFPGSSAQPPTAPAGPAASEPPESAASPTPPAPTGAASPTPTAAPEIDATLPPPSGLLEVLETNVASGTWTYEEGLLLGLRGLVGESRLAEAFGEMGEVEGTGIVLEAQRYLREGADETVRAELVRLLSILQVDRERLAPFSEPETGAASNGRPPGLAASTRALQGDCVDLWADGFPSSTPVLCFLFKEQTLGGYQARIYYPSWWASGDAEFAYAQAAHEALAEAWAHFEQYGSMGTIDLVFTILPELGDATNLAMVPQSEVAPERCLILVYPAAIQADQAEPSPVAFGVFKQTIAHELFHCYQAFNYTDKFVDSSWAVHDWWGEATAEYFSNVVYPGVNFEWRWTPHFDSKALSTSTFEMSYENFEFFQYLANRIGDAQVIALLGSLPAGNSFADQVAALSGFPEIQAIYHEFGLAYLDKQITDTSGAPIPGTLAAIPFKAVGANPQETVILTAQPFTLGLKQLIFLEKKIYANVVTTGAIEGERSARSGEVELGWLDDLPEQVIAGCGIEDYRILLTSTAVSASPYETTVVVTVDEEIECDECLIGTWELNKASFETHMDTLIANPDFGVNFIEGGWRYDFSPTGDFTGTFTDFIFNFTITSDDAFGDPIFTDVELNIAGQGTGRFYVDSPGNLIIADPQGDIQYFQTMWMNGDLIGESDLTEGGEMFTPVPAAVSEYTCSGDVLSIRSEPLDLPQNTPVDYDRVGE